MPQANVRWRIRTGTSGNLRNGTRGSADQTKSAERRYHRSMSTNVPTLYEWLGGGEVLDRLIARFYEKVPADPLLEPLFATMPKEHFQHVDYTKNI